MAGRGARMPACVLVVYIIHLSVEKSHVLGMIDYGLSRRLFLMSHFRKTRF